MSWPSFAVVFGTYLKESRDNKAWSQKTLSKKSAVHQGTISALEHGGGGEGRKVRRGARAEHIDALLEALGVSVIDACRRMAVIAENLEKTRMNAQAEASLSEKVTSPDDQTAENSGQTERLEKERAEESQQGFELPPDYEQAPGTKRVIYPKRMVTPSSSKAGEAAPGDESSRPSPRKRRRR